MNNEYCGNVKINTTEYWTLLGISLKKIRPSNRFTRASCTFILAGGEILAGHAAFSSELNCGISEPSLRPAQVAKFSLSQEACRFTAADSVAVTVKHAAANLPATDMAQQMSLYDEGPTAQWIPTGMQLVSAPALPVRLRSVSLSASRPTLDSPSAGRAIQLAPDVDAVARQHDIDPLLLHSIAFVESRHNASAVSPVGAVGVMQVMPATARRFGVDIPARLRDARTNLDVSATYLKTLQKRFGNDLPLVLASYNAGEGAVERYGRRVPPYKETQLYVIEVLKRYGELSTIARALQTGGRKAPPNAP